MNFLELVNPIYQTNIYAQLTNAYAAAISEVFLLPVVLGTGIFIQPFIGLQYASIFQLQ